jgi:FtsH-binding integral membrane protein
MQDFTSPNLNPEYSSRATAINISEAAFFTKVYCWMLGGLGLTAFVAYQLAQIPSWANTITGGLGIGVIIVQFGLVLAIGFLAKKVSANVIRALFILYAASVGVTLSLIVLFYPSGVIAKAFFSAAGVYGAMAIYGKVTQRSLQAWGSFLFMGLVGIIIATVINIFLGSAMMDFIICGVGVFVFAGLTAYDHQKLRVIHASGFGDSEEEAKVVIHGALELYLDFINLFLFLLRLLSSRD